MSPDASQDLPRACEMDDAESGHFAPQRRGETDGWTLYVVRLKRPVLKNRKFKKRNAATYKEGKPCVYVGLTYLDAEERVKQHIDGVHPSPIVRKFGKHLIERECQKLRAMTRGRAQKKEAALAEQLRKRGWGAWSN